MSSDRLDAFDFPQFFGEDAGAPHKELFELFDTEGCVTPGTVSPGPQAEDVNQRIARIEQEAYEKAFVLGEKAGREMGEASVAPLVEKLRVALAEVSTLRAMTLKESEKELVELAFAIAGAVIGREVSQAPTILFENVRRALLLAGDGGRLTLRVNPADAASIWREREALAPFLEGKGELRVEPHEQIDRGGCVAVTDFTEIDASIAGQCDILRETFSAVREGTE
ncbi:MAG TPA: FliH/SctL family protein [Candidatus Deferrimicrobiaceae bacterium]|jgi:flagellar biosynthesis/type III secretory pathway protein FliH